jgi:hypothetical protein
MSYLSRHLVVKGKFRKKTISVARVSIGDKYIIYVGRRAILTVSNLTLGLQKIFKLLLLMVILSACNPQQLTAKVEEPVRQQHIILDSRLIEDANHNIVAKLQFDTIENLEEFLKDYDFKDVLINDQFTCYIDGEGPYGCSSEITANITFHSNDQAITQIEAMRQALLQ